MKKTQNEIFTPDAGDWFTISEWLGRRDNSWKGDCLKAVLRHGDYLIADIYERHGGDDSTPIYRKVRWRTTFDLRSVELARISNEFVEASLGPEREARSAAVA